MYDMTSIKSTAIGFHVALGDTSAHRCRSQRVCGPCSAVAAQQGLTINTTIREAYHCSQVTYCGSRCALAHLVHTDWGMISPKNSTAVTDTTTAVTGSVSSSRNSGKAVMAMAL